MVAGAEEHSELTTAEARSRGLALLAVQLVDEAEAGRVNTTGEDGEPVLAQEVCATSPL